MKLNIACAVLCTALLASVCNAYPYLDHWDREAFLEQLQQEERVGADVEIPNQLAGNITCTFFCPIGSIFITNDNEETIRRSQLSKIEYQRPCESTPSIPINGTMYDVILKCYTKCPELSISNGVVEYHGIDNKLESRDPDTTATYSCSGGYALEGEETRKCSRKGEWLGEEPKCILQCPELEDIANGRVYLTGRDPGAIAIYFCDPQYNLNGTETRTCNPDGTWSDKEPTCQPKVPRPLPRCPELKPSDIPNNVPEAKRQLKNHRNYQQVLFKPYYNRRIEGDRFEGSKAYLTCVNGWKLLEGTPAVQTCVRRENGPLVWTPPGTCVYHYSYTWPRYG